MAERVAVSSAEFIRNIGRWQNEALRHPISITHHGRERLVLAAPEEFQTPVIGEADMAVQEELASLRSAYSALVENMEEGLIGFDPDLHIVRTNTFAEAFLGRSRAELSGASLRAAFPEIMALVLSDRAQRVMRTRKSEHFEAAADGDRHLAFQVFPNAEGGIALFHNISEQHRLRRQLEEAAALEEAMRLHGKAALVRLDSRARIDFIDEAFCAWSGFEEAELRNHRLIDLVTGPTRREAMLAFERVCGGMAAEKVNITLLGKRGDEIRCELVTVPILGDFVPRGAYGVMLRDEEESPRISIPS